MDTYESAETCDNHSTGERTFTHFPISTTHVHGSLCSCRTRAGLGSRMINSVHPAQRSVELCDALLQPASQPARQTADRPRDILLLFHMEMMTCAACGWLPRFNLVAASRFSTHPTRLRPSCSCKTKFVEARHGCRRRHDFPPKRKVEPPRITFQPIVSRKMLKEAVWLVENTK